MREGNSEAIGALINKAQAQFDECALPLCPEQLTAPKLHAVLTLWSIQAFIWGGKGIGSQGDGSAQLLCRSEGDMHHVCNILESSMDVACMPLVLERTKTAQ
jgi:galactokinase